MYLVTKCTLWESRFINLTRNTFLPHCSICICPSLSKQKNRRQCWSYFPPNSSSSFSFDVIHGLAWCTQGYIKFKTIHVLEPSPSLLELPGSPVLFLRWLIKTLWVIYLLLQWVDVWYCCCCSPFFSSWFSAQFFFSQYLSLFDSSILNYFW